MCTPRGRGDRIRTCGLVVPNDARYQAALHPVVATTVPRTTWPAHTERMRTAEDAETSQTRREHTVEVTRHAGAASNLVGRAGIEPATEAL